jgi:hypothetical protein
MLKCSEIFKKVVATLYEIGKKKTFTDFHLHGKRHSIKVATTFKNISLDFSPSAARKIVTEYIINIPFVLALPF